MDRQVDLIPYMCYYLSMAAVPYIREVKPTDLPQLGPLFELCIRDSSSGEILTDEIASTMRAVEASAAGDHERLYVVAEGTRGNVLGIMGLQSADRRLSPVSPAVARGNAAELVNAFVAPETRRQGVGRFLVSYLVGRANELAYDEILVTSGPRYKDSGWRFWTSLFGKPVIIQKDFFGPGADAPVWRKQLRIK